jgi:spermidine/putrescine-binding protein
MTKWMRLLALLYVLAILAAACGEDDEGGGGGDGGGDAGGMMTEVGEGEGAVSIVAWAGYIEDGSTDPAYDWVTQFESDTGCEVSVKTAGTSDEMVALMQEGAGQFDLVTASGETCSIAGGTVQPLNSTRSRRTTRSTSGCWTRRGSDRHRRRQDDGALQRAVPVGSNVLLYNDGSSAGRRR